MLGFECTINPQNLIKIVEPFLRNSKFFSNVNYLNFRGRGKTKKTARDIYMRTLYIEFERDRSIGLGSTFGDGHTDTHTHTHTHTQTLIFIYKIYYLLDVLVLTSDLFFGNTFRTQIFLNWVITCLFQVYSEFHFFGDSKSGAQT